MSKADKEQVKAAVLSCTIHSDCVNAVVRAEFLMTDAAPEITPEMEQLARRAILNEIDDVTDAMIKAYEDVVRIDPEWEL